MQYILKHSEHDYAINELGLRVSAREILQDWHKDFSKKASAKEAWHLCFSIKEEVNPHNISALQQSVQEVLAKNFYAYKYVSVIHTHQNNPHIHVLINKNNLCKIKEGGILINVGRGGIVNENDLAEEMQKREIYAGFDVFTKEPMIENHPFLNPKIANQLVLTPHNAWGYEDSKEILIQGVLKNIQEFLAK